MLDRPQKTLFNGKIFPLQPSPTRRRSRSLASDQLGPKWIHPGQHSDVTCHYTVDERSFQSCLFVVFFFCNVDLTREPKVEKILNFLYTRKLRKTNMKEKLVGYYFPFFITDGALNSWTKCVCLCVMFLFFSRCNQKCCDASVQFSSEWNYARRCCCSSCVFVGLPTLHKDHWGGAQHTVQLTHFEVIMVTNSS